MKKQLLFIQGAGEGAYEEDKLLVASLQNALGPTYEVHYPRMVNEESPEYADWKAQIATELSRLEGEVVLVGHSMGGSVLLKVLYEAQVEKPIAGLFVIAAPYWGADEFWRWDEVQLPQDAAARLAAIPQIFFYHSRDDEIVPFDHLTHYAESFPQATIRASDGRGHQLGSDLADVAAEIKGSITAQQRHRKGRCLRYADGRRHRPLAQHAHHRPRRRPPANRRIERASGTRHPRFWQPHALERSATTWSGG